MIFLGFFPISRVRLWLVWTWTGWALIDEKVTP